MLIDEMEQFDATIAIHRDALGAFETIGAMGAWCKENFEPGSYWWVGIDTESLTIAFDTEQYRTLFLLRWA